MESNLSKQKQRDLLFGLTLFVSFALQLYKAKLGMGVNDEHFYTTLGYRLVLGDGLFHDDWHIAQLISVFLALPVGLFIHVTGGTQGIILYMRLVYALFTAIVGTVFYMHVRTRSNWAWIAAALYLLFTPFSIMALSYNTMSVGFVILALVMYGAPDDSNIRLYLCGIFAACAVLNTPYLILLYVILTGWMIVKPAMVSRKRWGKITLGALLAGVLFCLFVFSRASLSQVLQGIPHLVDPSHQTGLLSSLIKNAGRLFRFFHVGIILLVLEPFCALWIKKQKTNWNESFLQFTLILNTLLILAVLFLIRYQTDLGGAGVILIPIAVCGLVDQILYQWDGEEKLWYWVSVFHACMLGISSNVGPRSFSGPLIVASMVTVLCLSHHKKTLHACPAAVIAWFCVFLFVKATDVYGGETDFSKEIKSGPLKGLWDSAEAVEHYDRLMEDMEVIRKRPETSVLLVTNNTWEYLALDKQIAADSTYIYFWEKDQYLNSQKEYRDGHPKKYPALVFLDTPDAPYDMKEADDWFAGMERIGPLQNGVLYRMD